MQTNNFIASQLYADARGAVAPLEASKADNSGPNQAVRFAEEFMNVLQKGEATAVEAMTGKAEAHSVVAALAASELAIETVISVRDKVVEAYQEILRMPV